MINNSADVLEQNEHLYYNYVSSSEEEVITDDENMNRRINTTYFKENKLISNVEDMFNKCNICEVDESEIKFKCGKNSCKQCFVMHLRTQLEKYKLQVYSEKITIVCCGKCKCEQSITYIESLMDKETLSIYHEVLFRMYLAKNKDIISCPNSDCFNYNYCPDNYLFSNLICEITDCSSCSECGTKLTKNQFTFLNPKSFATFISINDIKSQILKYFTTKYCNNCNTPIEKADGCKHMECNLCGYSFCWSCSCKWDGHNELCCMGILTNIYDEALRPNYIKKFLILLVIVMILKLIFSFDILIFLLSFFIKMIIFLSMIFSDIIFIALALEKYQKTKKKAISLSILSIPLLFEACCYIFQLHPFSELIYFYTQIVIIPISFLLIRLKMRSMRR